jgi:Flp pilus assembly pilin Flp
MLEVIKGFLKDEDGISTVEIVVIISILVGLALLFQKSIVSYVNKLFEKFFSVRVDPTLTPDKAYEAQ